MFVILLLFSGDLDLELVKRNGIYGSTIEAKTELHLHVSMHSGTARNRIRLFPCGSGSGRPLLIADPCVSESETLVWGLGRDREGEGVEGEGIGEG